MIRAGDSVGDRYEVIEQLASGGMGSLWRARHRELAMDVALKVISSNNADPQSLERFRREAQAAARLRSPHIVQVLDYGLFEGHPFLVMELLRGEDLAACIAREGKLAPARCVRIVDGMAKAIQLAHDEGLIHRDLKPSNIFLAQVGGDELVKVLDFGVAKDLTLTTPGGITSTGALIGSPAYMSPEQVWSEGIGRPSDVWAMGVVAFEMLTGKNPFDDETLAKVFERIVREPLPKPRALNADLPLRADAFFEQAFARAVSARVPSARAFAQQFREALDASAAVSGTAATPPFSEQRVLGRARGRRVAMSAGLLVVIAVIGAGLFGRTPAHPHARTPAHRQARTPDAAVAAPAPPSAAAPTPTPEPPAIPPAVTPVAEPAPGAKLTDAKHHKPKGTARPKPPPAAAAPSAPPPQVLDPRFGIPVGP